MSDTELPRRREQRRRTASGVVFALAVAVALPAQETTAPLLRAGDYVGSAECIRCHEGQHRQLLAGAHAAVFAATALPGCETCHGPGRAHAEGDNALEHITMAPKLAALAQEQFCARCHLDQIGVHGGDMAGLRHAGKVCTNCHEVHAARRPAPRQGVVVRSHGELAQLAAPIGSAACIACHPLRDALLTDSVHGSLAAHARGDGCELCHGNGSLHESSNGSHRLIVRPDQATDGARVCRSCHQDVDAVEFHWRGRPQPYLAAGISCATCHRVHEARPERRASAGASSAAAGESAAHAAMVASAVTAPAGPLPTNRLCAQCHVPALCTMPGSTHASLGGLDLELGRGCGSCHAGGEAHARAAGRRDLVQRLGGAAVAQQSATCLQCHRDDEGVRHFARSAHHARDVGCVDCHGPLHGADPTTVAVTAEQNCARCHPGVAAEFAQPNHHPVPEGRMRCSSCHDVHGDRARIRDHALTEQRCGKCHPAQRGPFVYAHQAGRRDGCIVCHVPHGSSNRRLLQQPTSQQNCLRCHGDFPVFHDQTAGAVFTDCLRCHTEVHGSNHSRFLFR